MIFIFSDELGASLFSLSCKMFLLWVFVVIANVWRLQCFDTVAIGNRKGHLACKGKFSCRPICPMLLVNVQLVMLFVFFFLLPFIWWWIRLSKCQVCAHTIIFVSPLSLTRGYDGKGLGTCYSAAYKTRTAALYNLGSGSWLACWANDTVAHYAAVHCLRMRTIGPAVQHTDIPLPQSAHWAFTP